MKHTTAICSVFLGTLICFISLLCSLPHSPLCAQYSINYFSKQELFHTSLPLTFSILPTAYTSPHQDVPPPVVLPQPLIMLLSLLIAHGRRPCPAVFSLFLSITQRDGNSSVSPQPLSNNTKTSRLLRSVLNKSIVTNKKERKKDTLTLKES